MSNYQMKLENSKTWELSVVAILVLLFILAIVSIMMSIYGQISCSLKNVNIRFEQTSTVIVEVSSVTSGFNGG